MSIHVLKMPVRNLSIVEEELLSEKVRNYPVLYDKSHQGYKQKVSVENSWKEVADALEFLEDGKSKSKTYYSIY